MKFYFSTSECYENNLNNRVKYKFKNKYIKMIYDNNLRDNIRNNILQNQNLDNFSINYIVKQWINLFESLK